MVAAGMIYIVVKVYQTLNIAWMIIKEARDRFIEFGQTDPRGRVNVVVGLVLREPLYRNPKHNNAIHTNGKGDTL